MLIILSNIILIFLLLSCQNQPPTIKNSLIKANYLLNNQGIQEEFISLYIKYDDVDGNSTVRLLNIYHVESNSKWEILLENLNNDNSTIAYSRVINDRPTMPRGEYIFEIVDSYGQTTSLKWIWDEIDKRKIVYPTHKNIGKIKEPIYLALYNNSEFLGIYPNILENLGGRTYTHSYFVYSSESFANTNILYETTPVNKIVTY